MRPCAPGSRPPLSRAPRTSPCSRRAARSRGRSAAAARRTRWRPPGWRTRTPC